MVIIKLWSKLSRDWVHTKGVANKIINQIIEKSDVPGYALAVPMRFNETDLETINELGHQTAELRTMLKNTIEKWEQKTGNLIFPHNSLGF